MLAYCRLVTSILSVTTSCCGPGDGGRARVRKTGRLGKTRLPNFTPSHCSTEGASLV
jgi:hypothetical protein